MSIIDRLTGIKWKLAVGAGILGILIASGFLLAAQIENRRLTKQNVQLDARINNPTTGYVARLAQAETNVITLQRSIGTQNAVLRVQAETATRNLAEATAQLAAARRENVALRQQAARIMATPPKGSTLDARVRDIDARVLETLR